MGLNREKEITVVIPNYNGIDYIADCIDSLLSGSWKPEIVVVDNHSTDGSRELIQNQYPMVTLLALGANTGFCHAVNAGIHITRTDYVVLLNNDTKVDEHCIEELYLAIVQNKKVFSVQAKMLSMKDHQVIDDAGDMYCALGWAFGRGKGKANNRYNRTGEIFSACAGAAMYRMKCFREVGLFDERHYCYLEDVDIGYRAKIYGYKNLFAPKAIVYHAGSATTGSTHNPFKERMTAGNNRYLIYKNMPAFQYALNAPFIHLGRAVKKQYFTKKGLGDAYMDGLMRGEYLVQRAAVRDMQLAAEVTANKDCIPIESCLEEADPSLEGVYPLYLGGKVPFELRNLPNYLKIQGELWGNVCKRLRS